MELCQNRCKNRFKNKNRPKVSASFPALIFLSQAIRVSQPLTNRNRGMAQAASPNKPWRKALTAAPTTPVRPVKMDRPRKQAKADQRQPRDVAG